MSDTLQDILGASSFGNTVGDTRSDILKTGKDINSFLVKLEVTLAFDINAKTADKKSIKGGGPKPMSSE